MKVVGYVTVFVALTVFTALLGGLAIRDLWGWFVVPLGAPSVTLAQAIGLGITARVLTHVRQIKDDDEERSAGELMAQGTAYAVMFYGWAWLIGWVVHLFA